MSMPPPPPPARQHDRPPSLHERPPPLQNHKLAIRVVPYTPPRLATAVGSAHSHAEALDRPPSQEASFSRCASSSSESWDEDRGTGGVSHSKPPPPPGILGDDFVGPGARTGPQSSVREHPGHDTQDALSSPTTDLTRRPVSRRRNLVAVRSGLNKTFTLVPLQATSSPDGLDDPAGSVGSDGGYHSPPPSRSSRTSTSHADRPSTGAWSTQDTPSSPLTVTTVTSGAYPPFTPSPGASSLHLPVPDRHKAAAACNYRMVGGLRQVPPTSTSVVHAERPPTLASRSQFSVYRDGLDNDVSSLREEEEPCSPSPTHEHELVPKASFASAQTNSTTSETPNYRVYGHSSPVHLSSESLSVPSSSLANYEILARSSPALPDVESSSPGTSDSEANFVVHGDASPAASQVSVIIRNPRPTFSQESLRVPALRTLKPSSSSESFGYYRQRSRENFRKRSRDSLRAGAQSLRSIQSFSSLVSQEGVPPLFAAPVLVTLPAVVKRLSREGPPVRIGGGRRQHQQQQQQGQQPAAPQATTLDSWSVSASQAAARPWSGGHPLAQHPVAPPQSVPMIQAHPHQWSSQLSTVMSESEGGSEPAHSRSISAVSGVTGGDGAWHRRRSSVGWASSLHSRHMPSISSSLSAQVEEAFSSSSLEPPPQTQEGDGPAGVAGPDTVRDQDEDGDGLGDLRSLSHRPSRSALSGFFSSSNSSSYLASNGSSRANSLTPGSLPAWARVYYGSGERPLFRAPSIGDMSEADSRPPSAGFVPSAWSGANPSFPLAIHGQRRQPREMHPTVDYSQFSRQAMLDTVPVPLPGDEGGSSMLRTLRRKTSSIWSPHLRPDRRSSRYSLWKPPHVAWSADNGIFGTRNLQVVLFAVGFIFPFAWIIAALRPLPPSPELATREAWSRSGPNRQGATSHPAGGSTHDVLDMDETRHVSAVWWRNLNRIMSLIGLLVIGAVTALVVVGVRQKWTLGRT